MQRSLKKRPDRILPCENFSISLLHVPSAEAQERASGWDVNGLGEGCSKTLASARRLILDFLKCGNFNYSVRNEATAGVYADVYYLDTQISGVGFCVARSTE